MATRSWTKLSAIIPAYNEDLSPLGLKTEVIVVDAGSIDATEDIVRSKFPQVVFSGTRPTAAKGPRYGQPSKRPRVTSCSSRTPTWNTTRRKSTARAHPGLY